MRELVFFVVSFLYIDEDAEIMRSCRYANACPRELGTQLVKASGTDAFHRTVDVESRYGWVVGGLFGDVGDSDGPARSVDVLRS